MVDLKKLHGIFVDEANERLAELESGLLEIEKPDHDPEIINTIFRAAHTIKGSSGSIGLKDISTFTHGMEEMLDLIRLEKLAPEKKTINVLLEATDMIKEMIGYVASDNEFDFSRCGDLMKKMGEIRNQNAPPTEISAAKAPKTSETPGDASLRHYMIIFKPSQDLFKRGIDPSIIIDDLRGMGEIVSIKGLSDAVPFLSEMDPENLYLGWEIHIKTGNSLEEIRRIFEFVEEGSEINIFPEFEHEYDKYSKPLGRMLVDEGLVTPKDVEHALNTQKKLGEILVEQGKATAAEIENVVEKQRTKKAEVFRNSMSSTIRVDLKKLDHLINTVGEMVIIHSMFDQAI
ncbi:MAG: Hpt domain-containing protein, partial [Nitrospirae bacterium]|nr:Hpt domain-containing protein [Nitrospirota bacterium]